MANRLTVVLSARHERPDETPRRLWYARLLGGQPVQVSGANTKDEVEQAIALAQTKLVLVTSAYHAFRVLLTVVAALQRVGRERSLRVWVETSPGETERQRLEEAQKIVAYQQTGDVASFADGLAYLQWRDGHE